MLLSAHHDYAVFPHSLGGLLMAPALQPVLQNLQPSANMFAHLPVSESLRTETAVGWIFNSKKSPQQPSRWSLYSVVYELRTMGRPVLVLDS